MDKDRIAGSAKDFAGKVEGVVGDATGDAQTQASGRLREATGSARCFDLLQQPARRGIHQVEVAIAVAVVISRS